MSRDRLESHGYDVERMLGPFSALFADRPWKSTKANKGHIDIFGVAIKRGETYYRERGGRKRKLSRLSMERMMRIVFDSEAVLELGEKLYEQEWAYLRQELAKHSPIARLERESNR